MSNNNENNAATRGAFKNGRYANCHKIYIRKNIWRGECYFLCVIWQDEIVIKSKPEISCSTCVLWF